MVSIFSAILAGVSAHQAYTLQQQFVRLSSQSEFQRTLFELNRELIHDPELWPFYEAHVGCAGKLEAYGFCYLNLFDLVFSYYNPEDDVVSQSRADALEWQGWNRTIQHLVRSSQVLQNLIGRKVLSEYYDARFCRYLSRVADQMGKSGR